MTTRPGIDNAADEFTQGRHRIVGKVGLRIIQSQALPNCIAEFRQLTRGEAAGGAITDVRQRKDAPLVRYQGLFDGLDDIIAAVFRRQHQVVAQHRARTYIGDDQ